MAERERARVAGESNSRDGVGSNIHVFRVLLTFFFLEEKKKQDPRPRQQRGNSAIKYLFLVDEIEALVRANCRQCAKMSPISDQAVRICPGDFAS